MSIKTAITIILFGLLAVLIGIFSPVSINGSAMEPGYKNGDRYFTNKVAYVFSSPQRGDIVVFRYSQNPKFEGVGRIIGLSNEKFMIKNGSVYINGSLLEENYLANATKTVTMNRVEIQQINETEAENKEIQGEKVLEEGQEVLIPADSFFVMGDNRGNSYDSRSLGFVQKKDIKSKIAIKY